MFNLILSILDDTLMSTGMPCYCRQSSPEKGDNSSPIKTKSSLSSEDIKCLYKRLEKFDEWTQTDYDNYKHENQDQSNPDFILTYFTIPLEPNDW